MEPEGQPGLDQFWQSADRSGSEQHPLERELDERVDAVARYRRLIAEAEANGRDDAVRILMRQHEREEASVRRLRRALNGRRED
jgi:hypothetical protein